MKGEGFLSARVGCVGWTALALAAIAGAAYFKEPIGAWLHRTQTREKEAVRRLEAAHDAAARKRRALAGEGALEQKRQSDARAVDRDRADRGMRLEETQMVLSSRLGEELRRSDSWIPAGTGCRALSRGERPAVRQGPRRGEPGFEESWWLSFACFSPSGSEFGATCDVALRFDGSRWEVVQGSVTCRRSP